MTHKLARLVTSKPWWVIAAWVVASVLIILFSPKLSTYTNPNQGASLPAHYDSVKAQDVLDAHFPADSGATGSIEVHRSDGGALTSADQTKIVDLAKQLKADNINTVSAVTTYPYVNPTDPTLSTLSVNGKVALVQIQFDQAAGSDAVNAAVPTIRNDTTTFLKGSGLSNGMTGSASIQVDTNSAYDRAEKIIAVATVVLIVVLLLLIFRSVIIALLPIVVILLVHTVAQSVIADFCKAIGFQVGSTLAPILIVVLFGVGTDYIVFMLFRYREELRKGTEPREALVAAASVVSAIVMSAAGTVMAAFAALLLASLGFLRTLGPGLIIGVFIMMLAALTLVPAIFSLLGLHLFWPRGVGEAKISRRSEMLGRHIGKHPGRYVLIYGLVLVALATGALAYKATYNTLEELPSNTLSLQAYNVMASAFPPGALGPTEVLVAGNQTLTDSSLTTLVSKIKADSAVSTVYTPTISPDKTAALVNVVLKDNPYDTSALDNVADKLRPSVAGTVPGDGVYVGGTTATFADVRTALRHDVKLVFPVAIVIIGVILGLLLRALAAPLYLLVGVLFSYGATLGITTLVFQKGLGYVGLDFSTPIVLYLFVIAIGSDYNIATAHRLREELMENHPPGEAAHVAVARTSPMVQTAAVILAGSFASLMLTGIKSLTELGFGVAIGILITALILAVRLVPSISAMRHWHFWWPSKVHLQTATREEISAKEQQKEQIPA